MIVSFFCLICCFATQALKMAGNNVQCIHGGRYSIINLQDVWLINAVCVMSVVMFKFTGSTLFMNLQH